MELGALESDRYATSAACYITSSEVQDQQTHVAQRSALTLTLWPDGACRRLA